MLALALRGLAARKLRGVLTAFAILLGVAMVAGTFMLKGSLDTAFDDIFASATEGIDVTVQPKLAFEGGFDTPESGVAVPASLVDEVAGIDGVEKAAGDINDDTTIAILDDNGDRIGPASGGPPQIASNVIPEPFSSFTFTDGSAPDHRRRGRDRLLHGRGGGLRGRPEDHDQRAPGSEGIHPVGGRPIRHRRAARRREPGGLHHRGGSADHRQRGHVRLDRRRGRLRGQPRTAAGPGQRRPARQVRGEDRAEDAAQQSADIKDGFGFLTTALLVFAGISVFVGAFLIFNTFSITVAQRTREFGMLRTLGASSRQVLASVILEALLLGIIASIAGIGLGFAFVKLVTSVFKAIGFELPQSGVVIPPAAIIAPLIVGILATLFSAVVPALRATRVTPLEALQNTAVATRERPGAAPGSRAG